MLLIVIDIIIGYGFAQLRSLWQALVFAFFAIVLVNIGFQLFLFISEFRTAGEFLVSILIGSLFHGVVTLAVVGIVRALQGARADSFSSERYGYDEFVRFLSAKPDEAALLEHVATLVHARPRDREIIFGHVRNHLGSDVAGKVEGEFEKVGVEFFLRDKKF